MAHPVEHTIEILQESGRCVHPVHGHAFRNVSTVFFPEICDACGESVGRQFRFQLLPLVFPTLLLREQNAEHVQGSMECAVQCVTCRKVAHRSCAMNPDKQHLWRKKNNNKSVCCIVLQNQEQQRMNMNMDVNNKNNNNNNTDTKTPTIETIDTEANHVEGSQVPLLVSTVSLPVQTSELPESTAAREHDDRKYVFNHSMQVAKTQPCPLLTTQSFTNVAKTLQEHVLHSVRTNPSISKNDRSTSTYQKSSLIRPTTTTKNTTSPYSGLRWKQCESLPEIGSDNITSGIDSKTSFHEHQSSVHQYSDNCNDSNIDHYNNEIDRTTPPLHTSNSIIESGESFNTNQTQDESSTKSSLQVQEGNKLYKLADPVKGRINIATVAGGIAGGVVGMVLAGPAAAYMACYLSTMVGVVDVASAGIIAAGIATGTMTGQTIQQHQQRILTMEEDGIGTKVLLVRPNIHLDPAWNQIVQEARRDAPKLKSNRQTHCYTDSDIVTVGEDEIGTSDKVLLLVSRMLNDKTKLSGYMYRYLIEVFHKRARDRSIDNSTYNPDTNMNDGAELSNLEICDGENINAVVSSRGRRDDAHAVIKHVTACLLEEWPEMGSSSVLTEMAANAVEGLVFGQLYDSVYEEIFDETQDMDVRLWRKITKYQQFRQMDQSIVSDKDRSKQSPISLKAMQALYMLPEAHSAVDKLHFGVHFLNNISEHFAQNCCQDSNCLGADSLLKMVCQHLVWSENQGSYNAQIRFLEEFARDEQLLRGREGYVLVTLQASLHFLSQPSTDIQRDIF